MGISNVRGSFKTFSGSVTYDGSDITGLKADAEIEVNSIDTGNEKRDDHLRNPDFFDSAKFPKITFSSTGVKKSKDGHVLTGKLTLHGVTREISLPVIVSGPIEDPYGNKRIGLELSGILKRHDFGVGGGGASDKLIGKDVKLDINLEGISK
jgi:polyisoprenoid-binding protein YceI